MEERPPEVPQPIPEIPKRTLWVTLVVPPLATLFAVLLASLATLTNNGGSVVLILFICLMLQLGLVIGLSFRFSDAISKRYRGPSVAILFTAYLFGQCIVCLALWIGSYSLVFQ